MWPTSVPENCAGRESGGDGGLKASGRKNDEK